MSSDLVTYPEWIGGALPDLGDPPADMRYSRALLRVPFKLGHIMVAAGYRLLDDQVIAVAAYSGLASPTLVIIPATATQTTVARKVWNQWSFAEPDRTMIPGGTRLVKAAKLTGWPRLNMPLSAAWSLPIAGHHIDAFDLGVDAAGSHLVFVDVPLFRDDVPRTLKGRTFQYFYCGIDPEEIATCMQLACGACWEADITAWRRETTKRWSA